MDYIAKIIPNVTIEECEQEIDAMSEKQYRYGNSIDRPRLWDLLATIKHLEKGC